MVQIILTELTALDDCLDKSMVLKSNASQTLLAVMESHQDVEIIDRILVKIGNPDFLVREGGRWGKRGGGRGRGCVVIRCKGLKNISLPPPHLPPSLPPSPPLPPLSPSLP